VVLGSGLGAFADTLDDARGISTEDIPYFPVSGVSGHAGRLVAGYHEGVPVVVQQGRVHGYEGYGLEEVTHGVRVIRALGADAVILTNAAGSTHTDIRPGDFMLVRSHLNMSFRSLALPEDSCAEAGPDGADRSVADGRARSVGHEIYSRRLCEIAESTARELGIRLREGCLVFGRGPSYETAAEVRMYRAIGGHAACMSTVPEAVAAGLAGLEVLAISCISNLGTGLSAGRLSHDEVTEMAGRVAASFETLIKEIIRRAYP